MKKIVMAVMLLFFLSGLNVVGSEANKVTFRWFGQACFLMVTSQNTNIIVDPLDMGAYKVPQDIEADIVTVSHEHSDHNKVDVVQGDPVIIRGLTDGGQTCAQIDRTVKDVKIFSVSSYHDGSQGNERGLNAIFVFEFDGIRVVHLGDLGHTLSADQISKIGQVDVLMIPVGGRYTIAGAEAERVISQLNPKMVVFPMHFKTDAAMFLPSSGDDFVKGKQNSKKMAENTYVLDLSNPPKSLEYVVLNYK